MSKKKKIKSLSVVLPAFNDEHSLPALIKILHLVIPSVAIEYEIIIVNDGSTDNTAHVLQVLQKQNRTVRVITHSRNQGYGAALLSGFYTATGEFIFYTDSDGQYDVAELPKLARHMEEGIGFVTGYKISRSDPWYRKIIGFCYNSAVKTLFALKIRDVDCDFRLFRRSLIKKGEISVMSGAFDVQLIKLFQGKGARFREVSVHHYPRLYGKSQFFNISRVARSVYDVVRLRMSI